MTNRIRSVYRFYDLETRDVPRKHRGAAAGEKIFVSDSVETLGGSAFKRLKAMILDGSLEPGMRLSEKKFAELLGVSRTPVREAIGQLISEGLAIRAEREGRFVVSLEAMAANERARRFYERHGYRPHRVELEKPARNDTHSKEDG